MTKKGLYILSAAGCVAGYIWLVISFIYQGRGIGSGCLFKQLFHIPCPACGSTRAILAIIQGDMKGSFLLNPNGFLLTILLVVLPLWMLMDWIWKKDSYYSFYKKVDKAFTNKYILFLFFFLVLSNWYWNISKGL